MRHPLLHRIRIGERGLDDWYRHLRRLYFPWAESAGTKRGRRDHAHLELLFSFLLTEESNVVDIGAHDGGELERIVQLAPLGKHIAFEPLPHLAAGLRDQFPNVDVRQVALLDHNGEVAFNYIKNSPGMSGVNVPPEAIEVESLKVPAQRLDDALPEDFAPSLVKIDVEGAELQLLRGARDTLARRPIVALEHYPGADSGDVFDCLSSAGLRVFDMDGNGPYSRAGFSSAEAFNWLAHA
jgi:FkbM family methyltransferase